MRAIATLTYTATIYGPNGHVRTVAITLPYISIIADDPHYTAAPPRPAPLASERSQHMTEQYIRRALGRDREQAARALNRVGDEATARRIMREGA